MQAIDYEMATRLLAHLVSIHIVEFSEDDLSFICEMHRVVSEDGVGRLTIAQCARIERLYRAKLGKNAQTR